MDSRSLYQRLGAQTLISRHATKMTLRHVVPRLCKRSRSYGADGTAAS
jgi:hypothetical protein